MFFYYLFFINIYIFSYDGRIDNRVNDVPCKYPKSVMGETRPIPINLNRLRDGYRECFYS